MIEKLQLNQVLRIVKAHLLSTLLTFVLAMIAASAVYGTKIGMIIFAVISIFIYFAMVYAEGYEIAKCDKKSYTKEKPYTLKGFYLSWGVIVITIILYVIYYLVWKYMSVEGVLTEILPVLLNSLFVLWSYAFSGIIGLQEGFMNWYGYILVIVLPVVFSGIGYIAGLKDFDITIKLSGYIYENKEKGNGQK